MLNGTLLAQMFVSGANNLYNKRHVVDELNVFPVPDGDTGTNMSMTAQNMSKALHELQTEAVGKTADTMSFATLRGARGNSGVILSQFFRGMAKALKGKSECSAAELAEALKNGSDTAYNAVMNPTEGTILTVAREAAQAAVAADGDITEVMKAAVSAGNDALLKTPEMLPALKKAGVVDAGGQGWMFVLEGALYFLENGKIIEAEECEADKTNENGNNRAQQSIDTENIKFMYCTEFIVEKKNENVNVSAFKKAIENTGDCMLVIDDDEIVKVHIHTNNPGHVLECAVKMGAMINIKIDNMKHQHRSLVVNDEPKAEEKPHKQYGFVAICAGDGIADIFKSLGIDTVIEGGQTMNPSTDDILKAVNEINADDVFVFPNNKNIILAANQAKEISQKNVIVIPAKNIPECIAAMLKFNGDKAADANETAMNKAMSKVTSGQVTYAVRDTVVDDKQITSGDILGLLGSAIKSVEKTPKDALLKLCDEMVDEDTEFITLYYGEEITEEEAREAAELIEETYDETEVSVKYGGQPLYYYIISAE